MNHLKKKPAASVILPIYNAEKYLDSAIKSVLEQDFENFELLLLNDGSTDRSISCLEYYAARDKRCKLHSWTNRGLIKTLNAGVQLANSDILIRMDADDICRPTRFTKQLSYMSEHPECVALGSRVMLIDAENWPITEFFADKLEHDEIDAVNLSGNGGGIAHPTAVIRKGTILQVGGYRSDYPHAEDIDLFLRLAEIGRLSNLSDILLDYRQHPSSIGYRYSQTQKESSRRAVVGACVRRGIEIPLWQKQSDLTKNTSSPADIHQKWGWWALRTGNLKTARKHAWKALSLRPFDKNNLKLCACALRGY